MKKFLIEEKPEMFSYEHMLARIGIHVVDSIITPSNACRHQVTLPQDARHGMLVIPVSPAFIERSHQRTGVASKARVYVTPTNSLVLLMHLQAGSSVAGLVLDGADTTLHELLHRVRNDTALHVNCVATDGSGGISINIPLGSANLNHFLHDKRAPRSGELPHEVQLEQLAASFKVIREKEIRALANGDDIDDIVLSVSLPKRPDESEECSGKNSTRH